MCVAQEGHFQSCAISAGLLSGASGQLDVAGNFSTERIGSSRS